MNRPWANRIDPYPLGSQLHRERSSKSDDSPLCRGVVYHCLRSFEGGDGGCVDDASSPGHVGERVLCEGEHGEDVGAEG